MPDKNVTDAAEEVKTPDAIGESPWQMAMRDVNDKLEKARQEAIELRNEIRAVENRLHGRISLIDQKLTSPAGTFATNKLPAIGDTVGDAEVVHVSAGVPGVSGPSVVTRGKD